jgi:hypothetical protein
MVGKTTARRLKQQSSPTPEGKKEAEESEVSHHPADPREWTGVAISRRRLGVSSVRLSHVSPPLTSYARPWRCTGNAGTIVGTIPENIRVCARRERGWPWEHGGSGWGHSSYWRCCSGSLRCQGTATAAGMGTGGMGIKAMGIEAMGIEGRGSSSARALSSPSEHTGGRTGSPIPIRRW